MNDEWRLEARELEHDLGVDFQDRVIVSHDEARVYLYAGSREQVEAARRLVLSLASEHDWTVDAEIRRWHPIAEEWEVRVDPGSRHEAARFARQLRQESIPNFHCWRFVLVGAMDEDAAKALAERIRAEAPADGKIAVEGVWRMAWDECPRNPFAFMGGLANA